MTYTSVENTHWKIVLDGALAVLASEQDKPCTLYITEECMYTYYTIINAQVLRQMK